MNEDISDFYEELENCKTYLVTLEILYDKINNENIELDISNTCNIHEGFVIQSKDYSKVLSDMLLNEIKKTKKEIQRFMDETRDMLIS